MNVIDVILMYDSYDLEVVYTKPLKSRFALKTCSKKKHFYTEESKKNPLRSEMERPR